jgi:hypothetical protein|tara:strand:+ start:278 stop:385 length:108 start_codon:yes stop_codon:yes gene_type:complete
VGIGGGELPSITDEVSDKLTNKMENMVANFKKFFT